YVDVDEPETVTDGDERKTRVCVGGVTWLCLGGKAYDPGTVHAGDLDANRLLAELIDSDRVRWDRTDLDHALLYRDENSNGLAEVGEQRLTGPGEGTVIRPWDSDKDTRLQEFKNHPHGHATHTAGTLIGDGS